MALQWQNCLVLGERKKISNSEIKFLKNKKIKLFAKTFYLELLRETFMFCCHTDISLKKLEFKII